MTADSDNPEIAQLQREVRHQGELIDALLRKVGIGQLEAAGSPDSPPEDVVDALRAGSKIEAIRLWRARTGSGLAEAKDAVEVVARSIGA